MCGVIVVDAESFRSLSRTWCLYTWSYLDNLIIIRFSINCSTVICSPTVLFAFKREASSETYGPRFYLLSYLLSIYFYFHLYISCIYIIKYQKHIYLIILSLLDLTFASGREGIDNPFIALVARFIFVCVGARDLCVASYWIDTLVLKKWGKYLRYFVASPFPLQGKTNAVLKR